MNEGADLARSLGPMLREQCEGHLGELEWFRTAWGRSGAATAKADWTLPDGRAVPAILKLPVKPVEYRWTRDMGTADLRRWDEAATHPTPRVLACGTQIGPYDLAWIVVERFEQNPLSTDLSEQSLTDLVLAVAAFQQAAESHGTPKGPLLDLPFSEQLEKGRELVRDRLIPIEEPQRWNEALKKGSKCLPRALAIWNTRPVNAWCHGDVHPGNAMRREQVARSESPGQCVLIDLGLVHAGHWAEDALYLERQFWGHADRMGKLRPVSVLARARREAGLDNGPDYAEIANARRLLSALCVPALFVTEGSNQAYVEHALGTLERLAKSFS